jgi:hypothetical protein
VGRCARSFITDNPGLIGSKIPVGNLGGDGCGYAISPNTGIVATGLGGTCPATP